jgi:hypothetical protein
VQVPKNPAELFALQTSRLVVQNAYEKIKVYSDEEKTNALNEFSEIIKSQEDSEIVIKELMEELNLH